MMERFKIRYACRFAAASVLGLTSCAVPPPVVSQPTSFASDDKSVPKFHVTQAELQDDLLRFESQFNARIQSASQTLEASADPKIRYRAALNRLIYSSNSLNIALGPSPESNLLDMITFIELSCDVHEKHWLPNADGPEGKPRVQPFTESRQQIWAIAEKVLDPQQRTLLQGVISAWRGKHPEQVNVETVRLSAFSTEAGAKAAGLDQNVGGLLAGVQQTTQAVDSARLFSERMLYYAERAPFLLRLQARLGAGEILDDAGLSLAQLSSPLGPVRAIRDMLEEFRQTLLVTQATLGDVQSTVKSVSALIDQSSDHPQSIITGTAAIAEITRMLKEWNHLLTSVPHQKGIAQIADVANQVEREGDRFLINLAWLGGGLIALFWTLYVLSKLACPYFLRKVMGGAKPAGRER